MLAIQGYEYLVSAAQKLFEKGSIPPKTINGVYNASQININQGYKRGHNKYNVTIINQNN